MPPVKTHMAISKQRTGKTYEALHKWIDEKRGIAHRNKRHFYTPALRKYVFENFGGQQAVQEWLLHIAIDAFSTYNMKNSNSKYSIVFLGNYVSYNEE